MFYIEKISQLNKRDVTLMHIAPATIVFIAFFIITIWNWVQLRNNLEDSRQDILVKSAQATSDNIAGTISRYEDIQNSGAGLFESSEYVSKEEWKRFVSIFDLPGRYSGIEAIGYTKLIPTEKSDQAIEEIRSEEEPGFKIYPEGSRPLYAPVVYNEPSTRKNSESVGYDMLSSPRLRAAMDQARDSGEPSISRTLMPSKGSPFGNQSEFIIYSPIYRKDSPNTTLNDRRKNILGFVYLEIENYNFLNQFYDPFNSNVGLKIYDPDKPDGYLLYESPNFTRLAAQDGSKSLSRNVSLNNRSWTVSIVNGPDILSANDRQRPTTSLWGGILFSIFLAFFIYTLLLNRTRALGEKDEKKIQLAKDELLALASHQLRTPATGVKQYIGMLLEGYAGKLTREQKKYLKQAYSSNERQLNTINDMLFVARADTGEIEFSFNKFDLRELLADILREQSRTIKENGQTLVRNLGAKPVLIPGDSRYIRMAVENLISNATKYTPSGGTISVSLKKTKQNALIKVEDTGVGVHKKYYDLLFRKFSRVPNSLTNQVSGSGIGLYLAKKVVDAHRGKIDFKSVDGKGSVCTIKLPLSYKVRGKKPR